MNGTHTAVVTGVHGLQHIQRLGSPNLPHDDSIRPHPKRVDDQISGGDSSTTFDVGWARLHPYQMLLVKHQLRRVFDRHNPLLRWDGFGQGTQERGLTGTRPTGNEKAESMSHGGSQKIGHFL